MAGSDAAKVDHVDAGVSTPSKELSVRKPDLAEKGKSSEGPGSSSAMAGDKVADMFGRLHLTSQESNAFFLEDKEDEYPGCPEWALVGKVLAPNTLHVTTIKSVLRPAWGNPKGLEFRPLGANIFMAEFACKADRDRVLSGSPWNLSKHGVLLKIFDPAIRPSDVYFDRLTLWACILNLPFGLMNDGRGKMLASNIGEIDRMDVDDLGRAWGDYLRFRVSIKVAEPLMHCVTVYSQKRQTTDVYQVMYEHMPIYCFSCGVLGHSSLVCPSPGDRDAEGLLPYHGAHLCVPDDRKKKQSSTKSGQSSFSSNRTEPGNGQSGPKTQSAPKQAGEAVGEITSPKKPK
jgi:hypothetical protein